MMNIYEPYIEALHKQLRLIDKSLVDRLAYDLFSIWCKSSRVFICGNGGSAANAIHISNDFSYGINPDGKALDVEALTANTAIISCLANDTSYEHVFSHQLRSKAKKGDLLIVLSGSGNSPNIISAVIEGKKKGVKVYGIFGFSGGAAKTLVDVCIHTPVNDMQVAEDIQLIIGHWLMRHLFQKIQEFIGEQENDRNRI